MDDKLKEIILDLCSWDPEQMTDDEYKEKQSKAIAEIKAVFLELIGEDEPEGLPYPKNGIDDNKLHRNQLRAELRKKLGG